MEGARIPGKELQVKQDYPPRTTYEREIHFYCVKP